MSDEILKADSDCVPGKCFSIEAIELGPMENGVYIICDHATKRAAIVDPAWDVQRIIARAKEKGYSWSCRSY